MRNDTQTYLCCADCGEYINSTEADAHECLFVDDRPRCPECSAPLYTRERMYIDKEVIGCEEGDTSAPETGAVIRKEGDETYHPHYTCPECHGNFAFLDLRPIPKGMEGRHDED